MPKPVLIEICDRHHLTRCILCGCNTKSGYRRITWLDKVHTLYCLRGEARLTRCMTLNRGARTPEVFIREEHWFRQRLNLPPVAPLLLVHDACWELLARCVGEEMISDLDKMWNVLVTLPSPWAPFACPDPSSWHSPHRTPDVTDLLVNAKPLPEPCVNSKSSLLTMGTNCNDSFARLPLELRQEITVLMPVTDYLNLRYASRAMASLFHSRQFWKLHFLRNGSRGFWCDIAADYDFESSDDDDDGVDWQLLFHATSKLARTKKRAEFTMKVWEVVLWIRDALAARAMDNSLLDFSGRALQYYHNDIDSGGKRIERKSLASPSGSTLSTVLVSYLRSGKRVRGRDTNEMVHLSQVIALQFKYENGDNITLGTPDSWDKPHWPKSAGEGVFLINQDLDASSFAGFCVRYYYKDGKVSSLGILQRGQELPVSMAGSDFQISPLFEIRMEHVVEVVATFEGSALTDIGVRGWGCGKPTKYRQLG
ncbi:hypothetical protein BJX64DRAFT_294000 [Aspergillus heterothallicus]